MKEKNLKIIVRILAIILICLVSFIGVYVQEKTQIINKVKDYQLGMDLKGARVITIKVNEETEEVIKDSEGNVIENATDEEIEQNGYIKENVAINDESILNIENYKKSKEIIEARLKKLQVQDYKIKLDEQNGDIVLEIPEDENTDYIVSNINQVGNFQIADSQDTENVLLNNNHIKKANVLYNTTSSGTIVYLNMEFNKEGKEKLKEITKGEYATKEEVENEENNEDKENQEETNNEEENTENSAENSEENAENSEENSNENTEVEEKDEKTQKEVTLKVDNSTMITSSFDTPIEDGIIQLSMNAATTDTKTLQSTIQEATTKAMLIEESAMPIEYVIDANEYIASEITEEVVIKLIIAVAIIVAIALIFLIIKYNKIGVLTTISYLGYIALYMLVIRYTNVQITMEGIVGILVTLVLNYVLSKKMLENTKEIEDIIEKSTMQAYKDFCIKIIPICIISVIASFIKWMPFSSFGMTLIWGLITISIYNIIITKKLIDTK